ncbi:MAG: hypothetical protein ACTJGX_01600 [Corynebacterium casei]|nr:hypothetical protein [Corynebacterium casei]SLM87624.1 hypothetical protein CZ765_01850 [Corynebacterium casei]
MYRLRLMDGEKVMVERPNYPLEVGQQIERPTLIQVLFISGY